MSTFNPPISPEWRTVIVFQIVSITHQEQYKYAIVCVLRVNYCPPGCKSPSAHWADVLGHNSYLIGDPHLTSELFYHLQTQNSDSGEIMRCIILYLMIKR